EMLQLFAQQQKKTISADVFASMIFDALGYRPRNPLIVDMTDEQKQAQSQPPPEKKIEMMMQQQDLAADKQKHQQQNQTKLLNTLLQTIFSHAGTLATLDDKHIQHGEKMEHEKKLAAQQMAQAQLESKEEGSEAA